MYLFGKQIATDVWHLAAEAIDLVAFKAQHSRGQEMLHLIQELVNEVILQSSSFVRKDRRS